MGGLQRVTGIEEVLNDMQKIALAILVVGVLGVAAYLYTNAMDRAAVAERHREAAKRRDFAEHEAAQRRDFAEHNKRMQDCVALVIAEQCPMGRDGKRNIDCTAAQVVMCFEVFAPELKALQERYGVVVE